MMPVARRTADAAGRGVRATRAWAAPQLERTAQVLQGKVAPKVSAALTTAAHRLEPTAPSRRQWWRKLAGASALTGAAGAAAAAVLRRKPGTTSAGDAGDEEPEAQTPDGQTSTGPAADSNAEVNGRARTS